MAAYHALRLLHRAPLLFRTVVTLLAAAACQPTQAEGASAAPAEERLVGLWLGLHDRVQFPSGCGSGEPMRYSPDGSFVGPGARGTWQLRDGRLTETTTVIDKELGGDPAAIGKPYVSDLAWKATDTFIKTFPDGLRMTFRRCPDLATSAARAHSKDADGPVRERWPVPARTSGGRSNRPR
jgi:hypothetical protein